MKKLLFALLFILLVGSLGGYFLFFGDSPIEKKDISKIDLSECLTLQGERDHINNPKALSCWIDLAKEHKDPSICKESFWRQYVEKCYEAVSQHFNDVSMCDGLEFVGGVNYDRKRKCYNEFAYRVDWDICEHPFLSSYPSDAFKNSSDACFLKIVQNSAFQRDWETAEKPISDSEIDFLCGRIGEEELSRACLKYKKVS